ncbi:ABC transporter permease [Selenomonadales bacterium OttesenSCG-928-I06]|nr:ABC transporter permease [Selenomonadales bacterium OttesenSCG-928-I06]
MFWESVIIAFEGLKANKLRSILTMLGIIIGVAAVVAIVSLGNGVKNQIEDSIAGLGSNLLIVTPGSVSPTGVRVVAGSITSLTYKDSQAVAREIEGISYVAPSASGSFQIVYGNQNWTTTVEGVTPEYMFVRNYSLSEGVFISNQDNITRAKVAVIGQTIAENLFGDVDPVGKTIRIKNSPFRVVGVLSEKGQSGGGQDQDDIIFVPLFTAQERMLGITHIRRINIQVTDANKMTQVQNDIGTLLRSRHKIKSDMPDDFTVRNLSAVMETAANTTSALTLLLGVIASISLLVGGIGIMNIMLVSVTERTREIGTRKALGATYNNILLQFLIESIVIGITGGVMGVIVGIFGSYGISYFAGWNTVVSIPSVVIAMSFSVAIGLIFGIYPARKAALLQPTEALRYE